MTVSLYRNKIYDLTHIQRDNLGKIKWPPRIAKCPDYWDVTTDANGKEKCNPKLTELNIGRCKKSPDDCKENGRYEYCKSFDVYDQDKATRQDKRDQRRKAWRCRVKWDGIYG
jgi:hypothetical protein